MTTEPGRVLLHYRIVEKIGEGGMGAVWRAVDTTLDREVAIKILPATFAGDPDRLLELAIPLCDALAAAHRRGITHRDLKPDDVMVDEDGRLTLLDFGLAKIDLGGGWDDPGYAFNDAFGQSPWNRTPTNGFRCIRYVEPGDERPDLTRSIEVPFRDFYNETPVSDETFALFRRQFDYDRGPLDARIEAEDEYEGRTRVKVAFNAAYGDERMFAYLFLPDGATPPYKTVVIFPGSNAIHDRSSENQTGERFAFLMRSGRAVMFPIYKSTYERGDDLDSDYPDESNFWKDHVIMWGEDLARSIDYLETREDIDTGQLLYYGLSWGGAMGSILPAIEPRIKVNLLYVAGLLFQRAQPEVDQINYVSRVTVPTLMVNGEYDFFFPVETSQKPLYDLLGTPEAEKKYVVYPGSHSVPRVELIRETLDWLDRWQGGVQ